MCRVKEFDYREFCGHLVLSVCLSTVILSTVLFLIFKYFHLEYNLYKNSIIYMWFAIAFLCTFIVIYHQRRLNNYGRYWLVFAITLGISNGFLTGLIGRTLFFTTNDFGGSIKYLFVALIVMSLYSLIISFLSFLVAHQLNQNILLLYMAIIYVAGVSVATINTHIFDWWYSSICALGMPSRLNHDIYNSTLLIVGMLVALFAMYMVPQFKMLARKNLINRPKIITISAMYMMEIVGIISVGLFPFGVSHFIDGVHVFFGGFVFYNIGAVMLLAAWLFSKFPIRFLVINYILFSIGSLLYLISFILCFILRVGWLAFPLVEFIVALIIIAWLLILLVYIKRLNSNIEK